MFLEGLYNEKKTPACDIHDKAGHTQMIEESRIQHRWQALPSQVGGGASEHHN
jgi:hypothetical protein